MSRQGAQKKYAIKAHLICFLGALRTGPALPPRARTYKKMSNTPHFVRALFPQINFPCFNEYLHFLPTSPQIGPPWEKKEKNPPQGKKKNKKNLPKG